MRAAAWLRSHDGPIPFVCRQGHFSRRACLSAARVASGRHAWIRRAAAWIHRVAAWIHRVAAWIRRVAAFVHGVAAWTRRVAAGAVSAPPSVGMALHVHVHVVSSKQEVVQVVPPSVDVAVSEGEEATDRLEVDSCQLPVRLSHGIGLQPGHIGLQEYNGR